MQNKTAQFITHLAQIPTFIHPLPEIALPISDPVRLLSDPLNYPSYKTQIRSLYHLLYEIIQDTHQVSSTLTPQETQYVRELFAITAAALAVLVDPKDAFRLIDTGFIMAGMKPDSGPHVAFLREALAIFESSLNPIPPISKTQIDWKSRPDKKIPTSWDAAFPDTDSRVWLEPWNQSIPQVQIVANLMWGSSQPNCVRRFHHVTSNMERKLLYHLLYGSRHRYVPIENGNSYMSKNWSTEIRRLGQAVDRIIKREPCYVAQFPLHEHIPALKDVVLDIASQIPPGKIITNTWLGGTQSASPLHTDPHNNVYIQLMGRKFFLLHDPEDAELLQISETFPNTSEIPVDELANNPTLLDCRKGSWIILEPGDALYIPQGYWHMTKALGVNFGANHWLVPE